MNRYDAEIERRLGLAPGSIQRTRAAARPGPKRTGPDADVERRLGLAPGSIAATRRAGRLAAPQPGPEEAEAAAARKERFSAALRRAERILARLEPLLRERRPVRAVRAGVLGGVA